MKQIKYLLISIFVLILGGIGRIEVAMQGTTSEWEVISGILILAGIVLFIYALTLKDR